MLSNIKITVFVMFIVAIVIAVMYFYTSRGSFLLFKEAEELYAAGDIYGAHEKAGEAMAADKLNRKAINLKSTIYKDVKNDTNYKRAQEEYQLGLNAFNRQKYKEAGDHLYSAVNYADNVSKKAPQYEDARLLGREIIAKYNELDNKLTEYCYNSALTAYKRGDHSDALVYLKDAPNKTAQIKELQNNVLYDIGMKRYDEVMEAKQQLPLTYYNDAIYWFRQIDQSSPKYIQAQEAVKTLTEKRPKDQP
ncbi:MAG: hypothetical protein LBH05_00560 [Deferribacteraceae bacterium]|jgi:tetratricopeptide (TPR) repeat protein|nr:hypothetical protein [Deferribacteraceae bacterium]